jgi:hypothetical protein
MMPTARAEIESWLMISRNWLLAGVAARFARTYKADELGAFPPQAYVNSRAMGLIGRHRSLLPGKQREPGTRRRARVTPLKFARNSIYFF